MYAFICMHKVIHAERHITLYCHTHAGVYRMVHQPRVSVTNHTLG